MIDPFAPDYEFTPVSARRPAFDYTPAGRAARPYVSIITPFFNGTAVFHETVQSVLRQSFQQWEWIIVNDASTDPEALAVLDRYRSIDPRMRVMDLTENRGPGGARNEAIRAVSADYIAYLDSDDLLEPTAIEKWLWFLESYPECSFVKGYSVGFGALNYLWNQGFHSGEAFLYDNQIDIASMIRRSVHEQIGGYDDSERAGLEDWDYWLRCANAGFWGSTIPEHLNWYRRRPNHAERWPNWDESVKQGHFKGRLKRRYPGLWKGRFPRVQWRDMPPNVWVPDILPVANELHKSRPRLLMIVPWLTTGGADKFNLDLIERLTHMGWEISIAATTMGDNSWMPQFTRFTPDVFILNNFLRLSDHPRFLRYLIASRRPDALMISHSEMGYLLLPYLRAHFPELPIVDYSHIVEEYWKNGGYPRMAVDYQEQLDLCIVASQQLKDWMVAHGADGERIHVCYINVDPAVWRPDAERRAELRRELGVDAETPVILFVGRMIAQKQPSILARTLNKLRQRGVAFLAVAAGDGPDYDWLVNYVERHQLGEVVRLTGGVPSERVCELMSAADIFFLPSRWEGIALVLYEAMASGLPIIGADVGGQSELVSPECGVLIQIGDEQTQVERYAQALAELIANPKRRRAMGEAGRERVSTRFPLEQMGEQMAANLNEAARLHAEDPRPKVSLGLGRSVAAQAVEYIRMSHLADQLWEEHVRAASGEPERERPNWRARLYARLYRWHEPVYRWYSKRGLKWLGPLREWTKRWLLRA